MPTTDSTVDLPHRCAVPDCTNPLESFDTLCLPHYRQTTPQDDERECAAPTCTGSLVNRAPQARYCDDRCKDSARNRGPQRNTVRRARYRGRREADGHAPRAITRESEVPDWTFYERRDLVAVASKAASVVRKRYSQALGEQLCRDDLYHEALIWLALHPLTIAAHEADPSKGTEYLRWAVEQHLVKLAEGERVYQSRNIPVEGLGHQ